MWIWIAAVAGAAFTGGRGVLYIQKKRRKQELAEISRMLEEILKGKKPEPVSSWADTISSKIHHQLWRLWDMTLGYHKKLEADRDSIKGLITEIAHQMRTPLTNMETYLEFLKDTQSSREEQELYIEAVLAAEKKVHFLTESFIKMSRLENRIIQIQMEDMDLLQTLYQAAWQAGRKAEEKGVRIETCFPDTLVCAHDANWLGEAVMNLLDNAVKYSQKGGQMVFGAEKNEMFVRIWVRDFGEGISQGEEAEVFQRFYRGKNAAGKEGFGIGLYLTREIVLLHHGFVKIKRQEPGLLAEIYLKECSLC